MAKYSPDSVDKLLSSISDEELRSIVRAYALTHPTMFEALKGGGEGLASNVVAFDYASEVKKCFRHYMKTPRWEHDWRQHPQYLDWDEVGKDLCKVLKRAEKTIDAGSPNIAIETAFLILEMDDRFYKEDCLCEREDWDADDLCLDGCFELIEKALDSPSLSKEQKLDICDRLDAYHRSEILEYTVYDVQELIDSVRGSLLTDDEHLAIMMRDFQKEDGWRKSSMACGIWDYLIELGRIDEAGAFYLENNHIDELRERYVDYLLESARPEEVMLAIDEGIKLASERRLCGLVSKWRERKLEILESRGDKLDAASLCQDLFADAHSSEVMKYYKKAKELVEPDKWEAFRDKMLAKNRDLQNYADSPLAEIYMEEQLMDRLYNHLCNSRFGLMDALSRYAQKFSADEQRILIARLEKEFPISVGYNPTRRTYTELAGRLNTLARICPAGKDLASKVINGFRMRYPNRPALMEELAKVKL